MPILISNWRSPCLNGELLKLEESRETQGSGRFPSKGNRARRSSYGHCACMSGGSRRGIYGYEPSTRSPHSWATPSSVSSSSVCFLCCRSETMAGSCCFAAHASISLANYHQLCTTGHVCRTTSAAATSPESCSSNCFNRQKPRRAPIVKPCLRATPN